VVRVAYSSTRPGIERLRSALNSIFSTAEASLGSGGSFFRASCCRYTSMRSSSREAK
jgi:hypothetical protein